MARQYSEQQTKFLEVLFEGAAGDVVTAKHLAGYSPNVATSQVVSALEDEISELTKKFLGRSAAKAAYAMSNVLTDPTALGNKERMIAAKDILDRSGFIKTEKVEVTTTVPVFILPAKNED